MQLQTQHPIPIHQSIVVRPYFPSMGSANPQNGWLLRTPTPPACAASRRRLGGWFQTVSLCEHCVGTLFEHPFVGKCARCMNTCFGPGVQHKAPRLTRGKCVNVEPTALGARRAPGRSARRPATRSSELLSGVLPSCLGGFTGVTVFIYNIPYRTYMLCTTGAAGARAQSGRRATTDEIALSRYAYGFDFCK